MEVAERLLREALPLHGITAVGFDLCGGSFRNALIPVWRFQSGGLSFDVEPDDFNPAALASIIRTTAPAPVRFWMKVAAR